MTRLDILSYKEPIISESRIIQSQSVLFERHACQPVRFLFVCLLGGWFSLYPTLPSETSEWRGAAIPSGEYFRFYVIISTTLTVSAYDFTLINMRRSGLTPGS